MLSKINFLTALSALVLFFLPWIDIQCSGKSLATQSGIQVIVGKSTTEADRTYLEKHPETTGHGKPNRYSLVLGVAFLAVIGAVVSAFFTLRGTPIRPMPEALCALALGLICFQMVTRFPVEGELENAARFSTTGTTRYDPSAGYDPGLASAAALMNFEVRYLPSLYLELIALAIPTLLLVNRGLDALRKTPKVAELKG